MARPLLGARGPALTLSPSLDSSGLELMSLGRDELMSDLAWQFTTPEYDLSLSSGWELEDRIEPLDRLAPSSSRQLLRKYYVVQAHVLNRETTCSNFDSWTSAVKQSWHQFAV